MGNGPESERIPSRSQKQCEPSFTLLLAAAKGLPNLRMKLHLLVRIHAFRFLAVWTRSASTRVESAELAVIGLPKLSERRL